MFDSLASNFQEILWLINSSFVYKPQTRLEEITAIRESIKPVVERSSLICEAVADVEKVLTAGSDELTGWEKNQLIRGIIEVIHPDLEGTRFSIVFRGFDTNTQVVVDTERGKTPTMRVIPTGKPFAMSEERDL